MHGDAVCLESVVVAVDGTVCSDIEEIAPKISSRLESMSHPSLSNAVADKKQPNLNDDEIESAHIPAERIKISRNKLLNSSDDGDNITKADIDCDADTENEEHNAGCYNQSFSKSESGASVNIDENHTHENDISDDASLTSSNARNSFTKPKAPDEKEHRL